MAELTITVVMPNSDRQEETAALDHLMASLASEAGRVATLTRRPGLGQKEGPPRVFSTRFSSPEALAAVMRGCGAWSVRNPGATVTLKMASSKGGRTLQLKNYSAVALANAVARIEEYLEE